MSDVNDTNDMRPDVKELSQHLDDCHDDPFISNLYFRYYQHLDIGCSHWRESFMDEMKTKGLSLEEAFEKMERSKSASQEAEILARHPGVDANLIRLRQKYGSRSYGD